MTPRPMALWERNLRTLAGNAERAGLPVVQCYAADVRDLLAVLDRHRQRIEEYKAAAYAALELVPTPEPTTIGAGPC